MSKVSITPWTDELFDNREAEFAALVLAGVGNMTDTVLAMLRKQEIITAAREPEPEPQDIPAGAQAAALASWNIWVETELLPGVTDVFDEGAALVVDALVDVYGQDARDAIPPVGNTYADEYLQHAYNRMVGVGENVWKGIRKELQAGLDAGEGIPQLSERLQSYAQMSEGRANTVARTEVISSANAGSYLQMLEAGLDGVTKEWLATPDEPHRTRLSHQHADDQAVPLTAEFQVEVYQGGNLLGMEPMEFPGDPIATPGNVINCRCSMSFSFDDEQEEGILTAAGKFVESEHPRDSKGKFMNKLEIDLLNATDKKAAYDKLTSAQKAKVGKATKDAAGIGAKEKAATSGPPLGGLDKKTGKKAPAGKPVFLRVKTLFETDYEDGAIVAVRPVSNERVIWDAGKKRMLLQHLGDNGSWTTQAEFTRGALMKESKDEEGWFTPSPANTAPPAGEKLLPVPAGSKPVKLRTQVVYSKKYADGELVAVHPEDGLEVRWDEQNKRMLVQRDGETQESLTRGGLMAKYKDADGWFSPGAKSEPDSDGPTSEITQVIDEPPAAPTPAPAKPAKKKTRKLYVEYNGVVHTRTTAADYKFVSIVNFPWKGDDFNVVYSWHTTEALAAKSTLTGSQKAHGAKVIAVIPVSDHPITPSVVPAANVPDKPQENVPTPADIPAVPATTPDGIPAPSALTSTGKVVGSHGATIYRDNSTGKEWLFKPSPPGMGTFMADADIATARLRELIGLPTPTTGKITLNGQSGSIQEMYAGAIDPFGYNFMPQDLTPEDKLVIQKEHIFDWLVGNHDGHAHNYVRLPSGELVGIDKGQAFKFFSSDSLDPGFKPNPTMPAANLLMQAYANGEGGGALIYGVEHPEIKKLLKKIDYIFNSDYREILRPYAVNAAKYQQLAKPGPKYLGATDPAFPANDVEAFLDFAENRKETLKEDFQVLFADLAKQRKAAIAAKAESFPVAAPGITQPVQSSTADGVPVKLNAAKLQVAKYSHGEIVAVQNQFGERLIWNADTKKYVLQSGNAAGTSWLDTQSFSKAGAVKYFANDFEGKGWTLPTGGKTHVDMPVPLPKVAGDPKPAVPAGIAPFDKLAFLAQGDDYSAVPEFLTGAFYDTFRTGPLGLSLNDYSPSRKIFDHLIFAQQKVFEELQAPVSLLALSRMMDRVALQRAKGKDPTATNTRRVENAMLHFLSTDDGAKYAGGFVHGFDTAQATATKTHADVKAIKVSKPQKTGLTAASFGGMTPTEGRAFYADIAPTLTAKEIQTVQEYTGNDFVEINANLRGVDRYGQAVAPQTSEYMRAGYIQRAMRPIPKHIRLYRGAGSGALGFKDSDPNNLPTLEKIQALVGKTFQDPGFTSTSVSKEKSFTYDTFRFTIEAPKGTPGIYVEPISKNKSELEMLLAAGTKFKIMSVSKLDIPGMNQYEIVMRVVA